MHYIVLRGGHRERNVRCGGNEACSRYPPDSTWLRHEFFLERVASTLVIDADQKKAKFEAASLKFRIALKRHSPQEV